MLQVKSPLIPLHNEPASLLHLRHVNQTLNIIEPTKSMTSEDSEPSRPWLDDHQEDANLKGLEGFVLHVRRIQHRCAYVNGDVRRFEYYGNNAPEPTEDEEECRKSIQDRLGEMEKSLQHLRLIQTDAQTPENTESHPRECVEHSMDEWIADIERELRVARQIVEDLIEKADNPKRAEDVRKRLSRDKNDSRDMRWFQFGSIHIGRARRG
ncbi:hypothetical protein K491DRAFT_689994 [Lophiostoma macrostomum CBS 122681]|uniref:Uncharacterized protein n=1 Tax=Lophiostoma macrostomum CBS 122681 TaxID=1314788 RepID=A0A6A6TJB7_9PLEO|nr:hypothetical protein K491DRAFT_689994 [Lophiostoma macrostomum CBS 122681]